MSFRSVDDQTVSRYIRLLLKKRLFFCTLIPRITVENLTIGKVAITGTGNEENVN